MSNQSTQNCIRCPICSSHYLLCAQCLRQASSPCQFGQTDPRFVSYHDNPAFISDNGDMVNDHHELTGVDSQAEKEVKKDKWVLRLIDLQYIINWFCFSLVWFLTIKICLLFYSFLSKFRLMVNILIMYIFR